MTRNKIQNDIPIIGHYNVNNEGSSDMYYKGANMLHTLRQLLEDDEKWRIILRGINKRFYHQTVTTTQIEDYLCEKTGLDLTEFFNQYLRDTRIPTFEYSVEDTELKYRYTNIVDRFDMPIQIMIDNNQQWVFPKAQWQTIPIKSDSIFIDPDFYIETKEL